MAELQRILIIGGGYAGVSVAKTLEKRYRRRDDVEITLVDRHPFHTLMTELHEVAGWRTEPEAVQVPFRKIFGATKVKVITDTVTTVDFTKREALLLSSRLSYDHLVLASGGDADCFQIPGVKEHAFTLWSFADAIRIRRHLEDIWAQAAMESDRERRKKLLTFVVAGAGFTGIEMVGELLDLRHVMCRKHHLNEKEVRILVVEAMDQILSLFGDGERKKAEKYLAKRGCEIMLKAPIIGARKGALTLKDETTIEAGTFIWTCGVSGSCFSAALGLEENRHRIVTDATLAVPGQTNVWAAGDNLWLLENGKPLPQIVETAHQTGELVAHNIIADIEGDQPKTFRSNFHGFMVSIGGHYGVADAGGIKTSGFIAMAMKHLINLYYLFTIAGVNQVWEYLKHEFLDIRDRRSIIGGFAEHKTRGYWLLPLRLWLGFSWFMEGANKIAEGWLNFASGSQSWWMFSPGVVQAGVAAVSGAEGVDSVSAASEEIVSTLEEGAELIVDSSAPYVGPLLDMTGTIFDSAGTVATWFRTTFMDGISAHIPFQIFQTGIVMAEIALGLALFGGAFTWLAAAASIGMCLVFTLSGMFRWDQLWFVFAAILCMGGAGRAFGLDYWIVRFFKKPWNGFAWVRRHHLYLDEPTK